MHTHTHTRTNTMEYYLAIKKNEIMSFAATWMNLEIIILCEISQTVRDLLKTTEGNNRRSRRKSLRRRYLAPSTQDESIKAEKIVM